MSTAANYKLSFEPSIVAGEQESTHVLHSYGERFAVGDALEFRSLEKSAVSRRSREAIRTKRRLKGYLVEMQAGEATVSFVENSQQFLYDLPADQLRRAGVTQRNQPFEMDEIEMESPDGALIVGYKFKALARREDAYIEPLQFDEKRKQKRDLVLKTFAKPQA